MPSHGSEPDGIEQAVTAALHAQLPCALDRAFRDSLIAPLMNRISNLEQLLADHLQDDRSQSPLRQSSCVDTRDARRPAPKLSGEPQCELGERQCTEAPRMVQPCGPVCEAEEEGFLADRSREGEAKLDDGGVSSNPRGAPVADAEEAQALTATSEQAERMTKRPKSSGGLNSRRLSTMVDQGANFLAMLRKAAARLAGEEEMQEDADDVRGGEQENSSLSLHSTSPKSILKTSTRKIDADTLLSAPTESAGETDETRGVKVRRRMSMGTDMASDAKSLARRRERRMSVPAKLESSRRLQRQRTRSATLRRQSTARSGLNLLAMEMNAEFRSTVFEAAHRKSKRGSPFKFTAWLVGAILWGPIMPYSSERVYFLVCMALISFFASMHVPFVISFGIKMCNEDGSPKLWEDMFWIQTLLYVVNLMDISLSFRSAYFDPGYGLFISERKEMALRYLSTWFLPDIAVFTPLVLACIPSLCGNVYAQLSQVLLLTKLVKVTYNDTLDRAMAVVRQRLGLVGASQMQRLIVFFTHGVMLIHWSSCIFHYISYMYSSREDAQGLTWVESLELEESPNSNRYITAMYWTICTLTTVGYGDVKAENVVERVYCVCVMLVGVSLFAYVLGSVSNLINTLNKRGNEIAVRVASVESFLKRHQMPEDLAKRINMHSAYVMERSLAQEDKDILATLSESLRTQAILHMSTEIIEKLRFFKGKPPQLMVFIIENLKLELQAPGEIIMLEDNIGDEMYFVGEGLLEVWVSRDFGEHRDKKKKKYVSDQDFRKFIENRAKKCVMDSDFDLWDFDMEDINFDKVAELEGGEFFGEYSCLMGRKRACSVTAAHASEIYILSKKILESALKKWPELAVELHEMVQSVLSAEDGITAHSNIVTQLERNADKPMIHAKELIDKLRERAAMRRLQNAQESSDMSAWSRKILNVIRPGPSKLASPTSPLPFSRTKHLLGKASKRKLQGGHKEGSDHNKSASEDEKYESKIVASSWPDWRRGVLHTDEALVGAGDSEPTSSMHAAVNIAFSLPNVVLQGCQEEAENPALVSMRIQDLPDEIPLLDSQAARSD